MVNHDDRFCPIANREIDSEVCYEIIMCLYCGFKPSSVPEVEFENNPQTKEICKNCEYSDWC